MRGYTLQEFMIVLLLGALIAAVGIPIAREAYNDLEDADFAKLIELIVQTARSNYEQSSTYTGLAAAEIVPNLPSKWVQSTTTIRHPLNGTIQVSPQTGDTSLILMTVTVQREDTCRRAILAIWPLIDTIRVDTNSTGGSEVKSNAGQAYPTEAVLAARCNAATHTIYLVSD